MAPFEVKHSAAVVGDIDMETAFMERDTDGFHYQRNKGMRKNQSGSRMVGGKKPNNPDIYKSFESEEYVIPDTAQQEATFMNDTKYKTKRRYYCLWALYFSIGVSVSLCKCFANFFGVLTTVWVRWATVGREQAPGGGHGPVAVFFWGGCATYFFMWFQK